jgi:hypothetical protein
VKIKRGSTSVRRLIFIADTSSTTGAGLANLVFNSASLVAYYFAGDLNNEVQITLVTATLGTFTSGGFIAVDNTNMPGWYEIGIPDAALDGGNEVAIQLQGATNMAPVNIYIELDAVDYQDATAFGLSRIDAAITSRMATYTQPAGFLAATFPTTVASTTNITAATGVVLSGVTHTGAVIPTVSSVTNGVTVTTNNDKTGYTASTVSDKTGYSLLATTGLGNQTANITGNLSGSVGSVTGAVGSVTAAVAVSDKTGFKLASDGLALVTAWTVGITGNITGNLSGSVGSVTGAVTVGTINADVITASALAGDAVTEIVAGIYNALPSGGWTNGSFGDRLLVATSAQRTVSVTGSHHVAADVHEFQTGVITASVFAAGAIDANALAADAATEIANAVAATQALSRLDSMIESDGAGQFRYDTIALSMAPAGGGGGGTDWTSDERTAIRSILGFDSNGTVSLPTVGVMDAIKDKTDLITSSGISVVEDRVNLSTITMQYNESTTATVNLDENTTSATLVFVVSRPDGTDILTIANGSITRTSTSFTVTITTAVTATLGQYLWSLRDITGGTNRVVTKGVLTVQNAASV